MRGFFTAEKQLFVYHKLFQIQGAWLITWFGFKPYVLKSLSLIYVLGTLPLLGLLYRRGSSNKKYIFLLFALFLAFFHTMNLGFVFRPETHLVFWGLLSYLLLDSYFESRKKWLLLTSAFISGIGIATHLNGVVFTGASVLLLWLYRRWWAGLVFGTVATWGLLFFFTFDVRSWADLHQLYLQLTNWRDVSSGKYGWESVFRIFSETSRYFHSPPEIVYSIMLLLLIFPARKHVIQFHKRTLYYTGLLSLCVAQVTHGHNTNYLMYALPFMLVLATWSFEERLSVNHWKTPVAAIGVFLVVSWGYDISKFWGAYKTHSHKEMQELEVITEILPEKANVLSHHMLIFPGIEKLRIQSLVTYRDKVENGLLQATPESLFNEANKFDIDYVVLNKGNQDFFNTIQNTYGSFRFMPIPQVENFRVYQRVPTKN
ncbi:MAG: hypothetical protein OM95_00340 [Bdellovibrio sp. ArHS]|nr:MAG: hypothetical protein OM95_00340 [Bdellovibrio sp. ArHS]